MDYEKIGDAVIRILARTFQELMVNVIDIKGDMKHKNSLDELLQGNYSTKELKWEYHDSKKRLSIKLDNDYAQKLYLQMNPCHVQIILLEGALESFQEETMMIDVPEHEVATMTVVGIDPNMQGNILDILALNNNKLVEGKSNNAMEGINLLCSLFEKFSDEDFKEKIREELGEYGFDKVLVEDAKREVKIEMVNKLLVAKFSDLPLDYVEKLQGTSVEQLDSIITNAFRLKSITDLDEYL